MTEPRTNIVSVHVTRWHGKWISRAKVRVGPYTYTVRGEGATYEEAYNAVQYVHYAMIEGRRLAQSA
jgi:hypothetical protein